MLDLFLSFLSTSVLRQNWNHSSFRKGSRMPKKIPGEKHVLFLKILDWKHWKTTGREKACIKHHKRTFRMCLYKVHFSDFLPSYGKKFLSLLVAVTSLKSQARLTIYDRNLKVSVKLSHQFQLFLLRSQSIFSEKTQKITVFLFFEIFFCIFWTFWYSRDAKCQQIAHLCFVNQHFRVEVALKSLANIFHSQFKGITNVHLNQDRFTD